MGTLGVVLMSHGEFAKAALESAKMIAGEAQNVRALALTADKTAEEFEREFQEVYRELSREYDTVLCLCDIYGGTPFNVLSRCLLNGMDMEAYTGLSLPLLIEVLMISEIEREELHRRILEVQSQVLQKIEVQLREEEELDLEDL